MKALESSQDKVQQLCNLLQSQAIEPAQKRAEELVEEARRKADQIIEQAKLQAAQVLEQAQTQVKHERAVVETLLKQAAQQAVVHLRQEIEKRLLGEQIRHLAKTVLSQEQLLIEMIQSYLDAIRQQGAVSDFSLFIAHDARREQLAQALSTELLGKLREGYLIQALSEQGIRLQLHGCDLTIDCTESTLSDLLAHFLRRDLRERLFA